ncbi:hypothetical protein ECFDA505_1627, partial [Escherichia coli FDA505]
CGAGRRAEPCSNVINNDENLLWQVFFCPEKGEWRRYVN